jgi:protein phosphatase 1 regulatory subunit 11
VHCASNLLFAVLFESSQTRTTMMNNANDENGPGGYAVAQMPSSAPAGEVTASATTTLTEVITPSPQPSENSTEVLQLTLRAGPSVRWDEDVVDNEGLGRKSSKRCCIFHKQRAFGESSTDSSDAQSDNSSVDGDQGDSKPRASKKKKIARPKKDSKPPDYQRFHA